jgi:SAM-dependent methyltransferase
VSPSLSNQARRRRSTLHQMGWHRQDASILELGPLDNPTFLRVDGDISYFDIASLEDLKVRHPQRAVDHMVSVDYVLPEGGTILDAVNRRFDLVVANHVIEHAPDLLGWLNQMAELTTDDGCLFLSVPDKRYTFDFHRQLSDAVDVIRAHEDGLVRPAWHQIAKAKLYEADIRAHEAWKVDFFSEPPLRDLRAVCDGSKKRAAQYFDVHCWVFTAESFVHLFQVLRRGGYTEWNVEAVDAVQHDDNEFHVLLRKNASIAP